MQACLSFRPWWSVEVAVQRDSLILVHQALTFASEKVLATLLAINHQYHPGLKWLPAVIAKVTIASAAFQTRLQHCFEGPLDGRVQQMAALIEDVFTLAEHHAPKLNVTSLRESFRRRRAPIERPADTLSS